MKAGLVTGRERFELVEVPEPRPQPGTAVVAVALCGICGTDVHGFLSDRPYNPAICGHEWVGTVTAVGRDVSGLREGDRVVAGIAPACGSCPECLAGRPDYCVPAFLGMVGRDPLAPPHGGFAPRVAVDARRLVPVHDALSDVQAAMVEPATVALHAVRRTPPRSGETVVVQGCGPIGLFVLQCARADGAEHIVVVEPNAARRGWRRRSEPTPCGRLKRLRPSWPSIRRTWCSSAPVRLPQSRPRSIWSAGADGSTWSA